MTERPLPSNPQRPSRLRPLAIGSWLAAAVMALSVLPLAAAEDRKGTPGRRDARKDPVQPRHPADPLRQVLPVPRPRRHPAQGEAAARQPSQAATAPGGIGQPGDRPGQARGERALPADHLRRRRRADAAGEDGQAAHGRRDPEAQDLDRGGGRVSRATGRSSPRSGPSFPRSSNRTGSATRSTPSSWRGSRRKGSRPRPRPTRPTLLRRLSLDLIGLPPTIEEVDAFLADARDDAYDDAGRAAARFAPLRRALGPDLARRRALCRLRRLREGQVALGLVLSRLGHRRPQPRPALRPVHHRADRRRPASRRRRRTSSSPRASCATR